MDRHKDRVAGPGQVGFFKFVAVPMYEVGWCRLNL